MASILLQYIPLRGPTRRRRRRCRRRRRRRTRFRLAGLFAPSCNGSSSPRHRPPNKRHLHFGPPVLLGIPTYVLHTRSPAYGKYLAGAHPSQPSGRGGRKAKPSPWPHNPHILLPLDCRLPHRRTPPFPPSQHARCTSGQSYNVQTARPGTCSRISPSAGASLRLGLPGARPAVCSSSSKRMQRLPSD